MLPLTDWKLLYLNINIQYLVFFVCGVQTQNKKSVVALHPFLVWGFWNAWLPWIQSFYRTLKIWAKQKKMERACCAVFKSLSDRSVKRILMTAYHLFSEDTRHTSKRRGAHTLENKNTRHRSFASTFWCLPSPPLGSAMWQVRSRRNERKTPTCRLNIHTAEKCRCKMNEGIENS